jgi:hypothetical protein
MAFDNAGGGYACGFVRGISMWPCLIPGDVLRAERFAAGQLSPGDIVILERDGIDPVVHRVIRVDPENDGSLLIRTAGDRSGPDSIPLPAEPAEELLRLAGVLRAGKWKPPARSRSRISRRAPLLIVRLHCQLVRLLSWGAPRGLTAESEDSSNSMEGKSRRRKGE